MMVKLTIKDLKKFLISAIVVGIISYLYNLIFFSEISIVLNYVNALEKVVAFVILGVIFLFTNKDFLKLDNMKRIIIFSILVSFLITFLEYLTNGYSLVFALGTLMSRFIGAFIGINIVNLFFRKW